MLGLIPERLDPIARQFANLPPNERVALAHQLFVSARLYRVRGKGGAIILTTRDRRVLAMDYSSAADLRAAWRETLRHYADF